MRGRRSVLGGLVSTFLVVACGRRLTSPDVVKGALAATRGPEPLAAFGTARSQVAAPQPYGITFTANELDARSPAALESLGGSGAGVAWTRMFLYWAQIQPDAARYAWSGYDALVAKAQSEGFQILAGLGFAADWSTTAPFWQFGGQRNHYPPADYTAWANYVSAVVDRYKGQIHTWEVWNEPDLSFFWGGTPAEYARLLAVTHDTIKSVDPTAQIVLGGLALSGGGNPDFLDQILNDPTYPAAQYFDVANFHHYGPRAEADRRMAYVRGELAQFGVQTRAIWVTEVGYGSSPPASQYDPQYPKGPDGQAQWLTDMLPYLLNQLGADKVFWFTLYDDQRAGANFASFGLLDSNLTPKPAYTAYQSLITPNS